MNGKHPCTCNCLDCIAYLEQELQCDIDEWMPDHVDIPQILCPSNSKEAVPHISSFFIGRRIRKLRIQNDFSRKWYTGIITAWDPDDKMYHAKYDDNDSEDLDHNEMFECINTFEKYWQEQKRNDKARERHRKNAEVP